MFLVEGTSAGSGSGIDFLREVNLVRVGGEEGVFKESGFDLKVRSKATKQALYIWAHILVR